MNAMLVVGIVKIVSKNYLGSDFRLHWLQKSPNLFFLKGRSKSELKYQFFYLKIIQ